MRDWKARLIGFGSDGAAVNLGSKSGVAAPGAGCGGGG